MLLQQGDERIEGGAVGGGEGRVFLQLQCLAELIIDVL
ncbi:hypothetical protein X011_13680 [Mycobacterium tuberculosis variant microti OV254]|nr:hypothetical protein X011_13680 [Mycobacterium tuberculosis variant microti OV254]